MRKLKNCNLTMRFVTPAFLGDASGQSELRSPPFKSLLRRWWRIAFMNLVSCDVEAMRKQEGRLFGHAWLDHPDEKGKSVKWALKSKVQVSIIGWNRGNMASWIQDPFVFHPEVADQGRSIGSHLHLGYGPLAYGERTTLLNRSSAFKEDTIIKLRIRYEERLTTSPLFDQVLSLWNAFGTVGSRSRNGWGSLALEDQNIPTLASMVESGDLLRYVLPIEKCMENEWPQSLGSDDRGPLLWRTKQAFENWSDAIKELARIKIAFRTSIEIEKNRDARLPITADRHIISYPVTNHGILEWSERDPNGRPKLSGQGKLRQSLRLPNQLYFKVIPHNSFLLGIIAHFPHRVPSELCNLLPETSHIRDRELPVWKKIHKTLDKERNRWSRI